MYMVAGGSDQKCWNTKLWGYCIDLLKMTVLVRDAYGDLSLQLDGIHKIHEVYEWEGPGTIANRMASIYGMFFNLKHEADRLEEIEVTVTKDNYFHE